MIHESAWDDDDDLSPELEAELAEIRRKMEASTTTLDVSLPEYLESLSSLTDEELGEMFYDRAFRQWREELEYSRDTTLLFNVIVFVVSKSDPQAINLKTHMLYAVAKNGHLSARTVQYLLDLSEKNSLGLEDNLAFHPQLSEEQAIRLAQFDDATVHLILAHNKQVPHSALKVLAENYNPEEENLLREILNNPGCSPEIRDILPLSEVRKCEEQNAAGLLKIHTAAYADEFWESFEPSSCTLHALVAALNPRMPIHLAEEIAAHEGLAGAVARKMLEDEAYLWSPDWEDEAV